MASVCCYPHADNGVIPRFQSREPLRMRKMKMETLLCMSALDLPQ